MVLKGIVASGDPMAGCPVKLVTLGGMLSWALDSTNVAQEILPKLCISRGSKARICSSK